MICKLETCNVTVKGGIAAHSGFCCGTHFALSTFVREVETYANEDGEMVSSDVIVCRTCSETFPKPATRGRPPVHCVDCRTAPKPVSGHSCRECGDAILPTGRRGRPAVVCAPCKAKVSA